MSKIKSYLPTEDQIFYVFVTLILLLSFLVIASHEMSRQPIVIIATPMPATNQ